MKRRFKIKDFTFIPLLFLLFLIYAYTGCPFRFLFGISCPGCGMTRAIISIFKLDFISALYYNAFVFVLPFPVIAFLMQSKIGIKHFYTITFAFTIGLFIYYLWRISTPNEIVYIRIYQGSVYKIKEFLKEAFYYVKNSKLST